MRELGLARCLQLKMQRGHQCGGVEENWTGSITPAFSSRDTSSCSTLALRANGTDCGLQNISWAITIVAVTPFTQPSSFLKTSRMVCSLGVRWWCSALQSNRIFCNQSRPRLGPFPATTNTRGSFSLWLPYITLTVTLPCTVSSCPV